MIQSLLLRGGVEFFYDSVQVLDRWAIVWLVLPRVLGYWHPIRVLGNSVLGSRLHDWSLAVPLED